ncbi:MAG: hypothetical protein DMF50_13740, partial [Acidobacteria bacterium]
MLPLLTGEERRELLIRAGENAPERSPRGESAPPAQAGRTPEAVALTCEGLSLTYGELSARAGRVARLLRARGVGPESRVGVCLDRSPEMIVAIVGILNAGGAYVPLDPAYPRQRLAFILEDSHARVILTRERLREILPSPGSSGAVEVLSLDTAGAESER